MKRAAFLILVVLFHIFVLVAAGSADEPKSPEDKVAGSASLSVFNRYISRGYEMSKNSMVIQPSLNVSYKGFAVTFWGNIDTNQHMTQSFDPGTAEGQKGYNETDMTLSYTYNIGKLSLTGGYIYYGTKYANETEEFFLSGACDIFLKPTLAIYRDINAFAGTYINLSLAHSFTIYKEVTLDLGASGGYFIGSGSYWKTYELATAAYTGSKYSGFHDGMVKAGLTIPVSKQVTLQPVIQYWFPLSGDSRKTMGTDASGNRISYNPNGYLRGNYVGGMTATFSF